VGAGVWEYTNPRSVIVAPPSEIIFPVALAPVREIFVTEVVSTLGDVCVGASVMKVFSSP